MRLAEGISFDSLNTGFLFHVLWSCDSEFRDSLESLLLTENFHHVRHSPDAVKVLHFCGQFIPLLTPCRKGQDCMFQFSKPFFLFSMQVNEVSVLVTKPAFPGFIFCLVGIFFFFGFFKPRWALPLHYVCAKFCVGERQCRVYCSHTVLGSSQRFRIIKKYK